MIPYRKSATFSAFSSIEWVFLLDLSLGGKASRFHANGVWGGSGGRGGGGQCGAAAVGSQTGGPAQQVAAHAVKQESVSGDPAAGFEQSQSAVNDVGRGTGLGQCGERVFDLALRTVVGTITIGVGQLLGILQHRPGKWV